MTRRATTLSLELKSLGLAMNPMTVQVSTVLQSLVSQFDFVKVFLRNAE